MKTLTKEMQAAISPAQALVLLQEGNRRFMNNLKINRNLIEQANETSDGQHPFAVILSCIDSRTSAEIIFDQGLGDVFSVRVAGNVINDDILGSMEFACQVAGSKIVVVLGHTNCGAIKGACDHVEMGHLTSLLKKIEPSVNEVLAEDKLPIGSKDLPDRVAARNVRNMVAAIQEQSPILTNLIQAEKIGIVGGMYDLHSGEVSFFHDTKSADLLAEAAAIMANS